MQILVVTLLVLLSGFAQGSTRQVSGLIDGSLASERQCLTEVLWYEARGVGTAEKRLVIDVVLNRLSIPSFSTRKATKAAVDSYGSTICKVIWSSKQFSYRNSLSYGERKDVPDASAMQAQDSKSFAEISKLVQKTVVLASGSNSYNLKYIKQSNLPKQSTHYATASTKNFWTRASKVVNIPSSDFKHKFYIAAN